jgi:hypothetical protein
VPVVHRVAEERWLYHCGDAAVFLGPAGAAELEAYPDALESIRAEEDDEELIAALDKEGSPTAYLFRCGHCGRHLAYADFE